MVSLKMVFKAAFYLVLIPSEGLTHQTGLGVHFVPLRVRGGRLYV
jgi:hypothetical protein